jgi:hypothetical protein
MSLPNSRTRYGRAIATRAVLTLLAAIIPVFAADAQMFAHRNLIPVPLDDSTRATGLLPGLSYYADIERAWQSQGDERAWDARLAGSIELWRVTRNTSILIETADELVANSLKDGGFNPRGISWELSIGAVHRFGPVTAQLDFAHYCRHAIDNLNPPGPAYFVPGYVVTQRTMSVNGPRLRVISPAARVGRRVTVRGAVAGERYQTQWDGREVEQNVSVPPTVDSWKEARGSLGADLRVDTEIGKRNSIFIRASGIDVLFAGTADRPVSSTHHENHRFELGWRALGGDGALEVYGAVENLFDDLSSIDPRPSHVVGIGVRLAALNQF